MDLDETNVGVGGQPGTAVAVASAVQITEADGAFIREIADRLVRNQEVLVKNQEVLIKSQEMLVKSQEVFVKKQEVLIGQNQKILDFLTAPRLSDVNLGFCEVNLNACLGISGACGCLAMIISAGTKSLGIMETSPYYYMPLIASGVFSMVAVLSGFALFMRKLR